MNRNGELKEQPSAADVVGNPANDNGTKPRAVASGTLFDGMAVCHVLDDGQRVFSDVRPPLLSEVDGALHEAFHRAVLAHGFDAEVQEGVVRCVAATRVVDALLDLYRLPTGSPLKSGAMRMIDALSEIGIDVMPITPKTKERKPKSKKGVVLRFGKKSKKKARAARQGTIYAVEAAGANRIKIGWSSGSDPSGRIESLRTTSPFSLVLLGAWAGTMVDERRAHEELKPHRVNREWFEKNAEVLAFISAQVGKEVA